MRVGVVGLSFLVAGCAAGVGRVPGGTDAFLLERDSDQRFVGGGKDYVLVTRRAPELPVSLSAGALPTIGLMIGQAGAGAGLLLTAHADVAISPSRKWDAPGAQVPTLRLQYQYSHASFLPQRLPDPTQATQHGLLAFFGWSFGRVIVEAGAGGLFGGTLGVPVAVNGWLDPLATPTDPSVGVRGAARATFILREGNLPGHLALRLEAGYQHVWTTQVAGPFLAALTAGFELVAAFF